MLMKTQAILTSIISPVRSAAQIGSSCSGLEVCREQLQNTDKVILMLHHFPTCPIFTTRGPASNGYAQVKSTSVQPLYGAQPYMQAYILQQAHRQDTCMHA